MRQAAPGQEIEIKLRVKDVSALRLRLKHLRAREITPRTHESNTLFDTPRNNLRRRGQLIRIRIEHPAPHRKNERTPDKSTAILTFKGPLQKSPGTKTRGRYKIREEAEVTVSSGEQIIRVLRALGFRPVFQYEKFRTTYALPGVRNVKVEFDETPVGLFLELEGARSAIDRAARCLGYSRNDYCTQTYGTLYLADCRRQGVKPAHMLFHPTKIFR